MAELRLHRTYHHHQDPVVGEVRTLLKRRGLLNKIHQVHRISDVASATIKKWLDGETLSPQNRTIMAVTSSIGFKRTWMDDDGDWNIDKELKKAADWARKQNSKSAKTNGHNPKRKPT